MFENYSKYIIILWIIIQLLKVINCQKTFKPLKRYGHTATIIGDKLYILGGQNDEIANSGVGSEFFYLDISVPFNVQDILWHDLTIGNIVPTHFAAASGKGGANNNSLILYGGIQSKNVEMALVYMYDTQKNTWNVPITTGNNVTRKASLKGVVNFSAKMFLFGGRSDKLLLNDMLILDTINYNLATGSITDGPSPRSSYGGTLLTNHFIIYFGGTFTTSGVDGVSLSLKEIYLYDIVHDDWISKVTTGTIPSDRESFSVVLGLDGQQLIIFGGISNFNDLKPQDAIYMLDLVNFEWKVPKVSGNIPSSRYWHQANVIGKYMVVTFGFGYDITVDNDVLLLDISNKDELIWTNIYDPTALLFSNSSSTVPTITVGGTAFIPLSMPVVIGIAIGTSVLDMTPQSSNLSNYGQGMVAYPQIPVNNMYYQEQQIQIPDTAYFYGQQMIPMHDEIIATSSGDNQMSSAQNIDNVLENFKHDIIQVVRQEIKHNRK
ncbi:10161_t:CDS:2 [Funneliformis caledonium]|uniref:10161_t:CDS:1 n=1 Tax=Funneliformis caledonium TaxID=1117310 RepID=A0A9N9FGY5_9GLOM|nr:10161_t:CDS:2 [Funneliformis caledonium]